MKNLEIAVIFREIAKILEIQGENVFRKRAYERAAQNIEGLSQNIEEFMKTHKLTDIPGVGNDLAGKIEEYLKTGKIKSFEVLKKTIPSGIVDMLNIPSIGPKTVKVFYEKLKIKSLQDLENAIETGKLKGLPGIKEKKIHNILKGLEIHKKGLERLNLARAAFVADGVLKALQSTPEVKKISAAGSLRRQKETVRDIDILVVSDKPGKVMSTFTNIPYVKDILAKGDTKSSVRTTEDVQVDCRVVKEESFGAALVYFTGSKSFNIKLRQLAIKKGLKVNEYGVFRKNKFVAGNTEEDVFKILGLPYIEPELRENSGEIELALKQKLPQLIELKDLKGDLHVHSKYSDGANTIEDIAAACRDMGYSYVAVADHSKSLRIAGGLYLADLKRKKIEIDKVNKKFKDFRVLFGTEVEIDSEGRIDYEDKVLKEFDVVVAAVHTGFKQSKEHLTKRVARACENKYVHIIAHPTGRLWGTREGYDIDLEKVFKAAAETNTHMEINSFPSRLDLNDWQCRRAKEMGVSVAINTDSHTLNQLEAIKFGISVARRGWLSKENVINTLPLENLLKKLKK